MVTSKQVVTTAGGELVPGIGLAVIFPHPTGVIYAHHCGGLLVDYRRAEGFAVPIGGDEQATRFVEFFAERFHGYPPTASNGRWSETGNQWSREDLDALSRMVRTAWISPPALGTEEQVDAFDEDLLTDPVQLAFDTSRIYELTEGWIPVRVGTRPGYLIFVS